MINLPWTFIRVQFNYKLLDGRQLMNVFKPIICYRNLLDSSMLKLLSTNSMEDFILVGNQLFVPNISEHKGPKCLRSGHRDDNPDVKRHGQEHLNKIECSHRGVDRGIE